MLPYWWIAIKERNNRATEVVSGARTPKSAEDIEAASRLIHCVRVTDCATIKDAATMADQLLHANYNHKLAKLPYSFLSLSVLKTDCCRICVHLSKSVGGSLQPIHFNNARNQIYGDIRRHLRCIIDAIKYANWVMIGFISTAVNGSRAPRASATACCRL